MKDMFKQAVPILKTLARDPVTFRTRDAKEGEDTLWDLIQRGSSVYVDVETQTIAEDQHEELFYSEADALEDLILFPDEANALFKPNANALQKIEGRVPNMLRFIQDLDTDEETNPSDDDEESDHRITNGPTKPRQLSIADEDDRMNWSDDDSRESEDSLSSNGESEIDDDPSSESFDVRRFIKGTNAEDRKDIALLTGWTNKDGWQRLNPELEFMRFVDREKSICTCSA